MAHGVAKYLEKSTQAVQPSHDEEFWHAVCATCGSGRVRLLAQPRENWEPLGQNLV